jgi:voltage-gated sodium channel
MFNMLLIIVESDHAAHNDGAIPWVENAGTVVLIIFVVELCLRLFVDGGAFFRCKWNVFDFLIVVSDAMFSLFGLFLGSVFPMSTLRVFRLCKLARVSKVFRVFPELRIMMAGLMGSFRAIFWGTVLLAFVLIVWAIVAVQFIHPLNKTLHFHDGCERCPRAYESVLQSTLTFSQQIVAGDSWGQATIPVIEAYPWTALFFMGVYLTVAVAVMNLILGVVVNIASCEHDRLSGELAEEKNMRKMCASNDILKICEEIDLDGDGQLSMEELNGFRNSDRFSTAMEEMDITQEDLKLVFSTMQHDQSESVDYPEFVRKLYKMKDSDAAFMLDQIKYLITEVRDIVIEKLETNQHQLEETLEKIEEEEEKIAIEAFVHQEKGHDINAVDSKAMDFTASALKAGSDIQEKETKQVGWSPVPEVVHSYVETAGRLELHDMLQASSHFYADFKDSLKHLESILDLHASSTSKCFSHLGPPQAPGRATILNM